MSGPKSANSLGNHSSCRLVFNVTADRFALKVYVGAQGSLESSNQTNELMPCVPMTRNQFNAVSKAIIFDVLSFEKGSTFLGLNCAPVRCVRFCGSANFETCTLNVVVVTHDDKADPSTPLAKVMFTRPLCKPGVAFLGTKILTQKTVGGPSPIAPAELAGFDAEMGARASG